MSKSGLIIAIAFIVGFLLMLVPTDASAWQRCGTWMHKGLIYHGPPCGRQPHWQHDRRGKRYWGHKHRHQRQHYARYASPGHYQQHPPVRTQRYTYRYNRQTYSRATTTVPAVQGNVIYHPANSAPAGARSCVVGGVTGKCW